MNRKVLKGIIIIGIMIFINLLFTNVSNAALSIMTSKTTVEPGEKFTVKVSVNSDEAAYVKLSANNATLSSDQADLMSNSSATITCTAGSKEENIKIVASGKVANYTPPETENDQTKTVTITVKAKEEVKQPENNNNNSGNSNNGSSNNGSTNNNNNQSNSGTTKSSNNKLKMLGIKPHDFKNFKSGTTTYYVSVPNDTEEVEVYAEKQESSQKISGTGTVKLKEGSNTVKVVCTAENGTTKTYTMYITREKAEEQPIATETETPQQEEPVKEEPTEEENNTTDEIANEAVIGITNLTVTGKNEKGETVKLELAPDFNELVSEYGITVPLSITEVNVLAEAQDGEPTIEVMGNKDLKEGKNTITVMVTVGENKKVFQITVIRTAESATSLSNEVMLQLAIIAAIATIIIVAIIALIIMIVRNHKKKKEKYSKVDVELRRYEQTKS